MKNLNHKPIQIILDNAQDFIEDRVKRYIHWYDNKPLEVLKNGSGFIPKIPLTDFVINNYRLSIQYDLIKAMSNYLLKTDIILKNHFYFQSGSIEIQLLIERDGETYGINTDVIVAEGEIQKAHYRYLVKTPLRKLGVDLTKRLKCIDKLKFEIAQYESYKSRDIEKRNDIENISFEEWLPKYSYHFRSYKHEFLSYQELIENKPYMEQLFIDEFKRFKTDGQEKYLAKSIKEFFIKITKLNDKLQLLINSKS
jgi:hypothetical protein